MMISFRFIVFSLILLAPIISETLRYWDLGVHIEKDSQTIIQKELDFDKIANINASTVNQDQILAFRSNNFIAPILHNLKYPLVVPRNTRAPKEDFVFSLSTKETVNFIKRSFLNDQFSRFFSLYSQIKINEVPKIEKINILYIQNLYRSNQYESAKNILDTILLKDMTDEMILYAIKTNIKLGYINESFKQIEFFNKKYKNSDLVRYVNHEKKLLNKNRTS